MTNLKSVNVGMNKFCGPAVLSILTGKSTDECARVISQINGGYAVAGVQLNDLLRAADKMGFDQIPAMMGNTLFGTIIRLATADGMYIITVPNHFVVIEVKDRKAYFCDNHTKEPIPAESSARLGQKVLATHKVTKRPEPIKTPEPVLLITEYEIHITDRAILVDRVLSYDQPEFSKKESIGYVVAKSKEELSMILNKLAIELGDK